MDENRLKYLLDRQNTGHITPEEMVELDNWFHNLKGGRADFEQWVEEEGGEEAMSNYLYQGFQNRLAQTQPKHRGKYWIGAAAAITATLLCFGYYFTVNKTKQVAPVAAVVKQRPLLPGNNKAILTLANGQVIDLNNTNNGTLAHQSGVVVQKVAGGKLVYQSNTNHTITSDTLAWNTISTPRAGQYELDLPDGTHVWLNSETQLRYPVKFKKGERKVELTGEAYFEVAHNAAMPFKISTAGQTVTVLGTHFNIKAYADESQMATTLLQGSVSIANTISGQSRLLTPGNQANIKKGETDINITNAKIDQVMAWKNGYFIFDNQDIRTVMKVISRWYDVDITYKLSHPSVNFGGTFSRSSDLNHILKSFSDLGNLKFEIKERRIIVSN